MLWLDALIAYLHFIAIFILFAFLSVEVNIKFPRPVAAYISPNNR